MYEFIIGIAIGLLLGKMIYDPAERAARLKRYQEFVGAPKWKVWRNED